MKNLWKWLLELDQILRGETTRVADLKDGSLKISIGGITLVLVLLGMVYGLCMAVFAAINSPNQMQLVASAVKVPALFLLTLVVTLPSLYVFTALVNARLSVGALVRLFVAAIGVNIAVLASLGPIVAFFSLNTVSYNFMVLLNVVVFAVSGVLGLSFLLQTLHRLNIAPRYQRTALDRMVDAHRAAQLAKRAAGPTPPPISPGELPPALQQYITPEVVEPGGAAGRTSGSFGRVSHSAGRATRPFGHRAGRAERSARSDCRPRLGPAHAAGVRLLGVGVRSGRRADELGAASFHRLARHSFRVVPPAQLELFRGGLSGFALAVDEVEAWFTKRGSPQRTQRCAKEEG